jgi:hypothetical protein
MARHHPNRERVIRPVGATDGRNYRWVSFPLRAFETAVRDELVEVRVEDIDPGAPSGNRVEALAARHAELGDSATTRPVVGRWAHTRAPESRL